ncbi:aquaporin [Arthrobacter jiangjiafuii]|uniref:Aquaporin n=1 Tax=Arthrobacter jiangjiafuii TaxID=2817475 RepID=A0A975R083_9MICC|nr:aquaporin [Arthrobacter jiangjiafuii]MBP3044958.1 aquaporin [Arthrobacter jiangjiafuii]QWC09171.1 aquaporin [Arthrobacter jiangjiafuii]
MNAEPNSAGGARVAHPATAPLKRLDNYGLLGRSAAEAVGSFVLVFAVSVGVLGGTGGISMPLAVGLAVAAAMVGFGYVSGGHFNPAISLASAAAGRTSWKALPVYVLAQLVGALLAVAILWVVFQGHPELSETRQIFTALANGYGSEYGLGFPLASALLAEVVATGLLAAVFLGATSGRRAASTAAFAVGVTYVVLLTVLTPLTGGSLNPARSTAFALFSETTALEQLWLFWAAPVLGALIAGLIYRSIDLTVAGSVKTGGADEIDHDDEDYDGDIDETTAEDAHAAQKPAKMKVDKPAQSTAGATTASADSAATAGSAGAGNRRDPDAEARGFFDADGDESGRPGTPKA